LLVATWPPPATLILNPCPSSLTTCQLVSDSAASTGSPHDKVEESSRVDVVPNEKLYHLDIEMLNLPFDNSLLALTVRICIGVNIIKKFYASHV